MIREAEGSRDEAFLRRCIESLQDAERGWDPRLPDPAAMIDRYRAVLAQRVDDWGGRILIAEEAGDLQGILTLLVHVPESEPDEPLGAFALVSDLYVLPAHRNTGVGARLLDAAEGIARHLGAEVLRLEVMSRNLAARRFYERAGFSERLLQMEKRL